MSFLKVHERAEDIADALRQFRIRNRRRFGVDGINLQWLFDWTHHPLHSEPIQSLLAKALRSHT
jgi:hypothetical protein